MTTSGEPGHPNTIGIFSDGAMTSYVRVPLFFFKQKTAYEILRSDWSSDVCSPISARQARRYRITRDHGLCRRAVLRRLCRAGVYVGLERSIDAGPVCPAWAGSAGGGAWRALDRGPSRLPVLQRVHATEGQDG